MNHYTGQLLEVLLEPYQNASLRVSLPADAHPRPGQYLLANRPNDPEESLPYTCFPALDPSTNGNPDEIVLLANFPPAWTPGQATVFSAPQGQPFVLPKKAEHLLFWSLSDHPAYLLPFISQALEAGRSVVLLSDEELSGIPVEVEVQPLSALEEMLNWCQLFIAEVAYKEENLLATMEGFSRTARKKGYLYVTGEFPCGGMADCGLCSPRTGKQEILPCKAGPLFPLNEFQP